MLRLRDVIVLLGVMLPAHAADITGHAIVTKRLTKKTVSPVAYDLRGVSPRQAVNDPDSISEFDRMVVILEGGDFPPKPPVTAVLDQRGMRFDNDLIVIPVGSTVQFLNSDPIFHNVFSLSKAQPFDLGYYPRGQSRSIQFKHAGVVQVYCHIHANMYAAIVVTRSPWFAKPASDGSFAWDGVPAGHYRLTAWHKIAGLYTTEITVPETGKVDVSIRVPVDVERP
jgi:plastocyanin